MSDSLLEEIDAFIQEQRDLARAEGEIHALQRAITNIIKVRFPDLLELAQQGVTGLQQPGALYLLTTQISAAPDEAFARWLLSTLMDFRVENGW